MDRAAIRLTLKSLRSNTSAEQQRNCARLIGEGVCAQDFFKQSQRIALYLPVSGEVDTRFIVEQARKLNKQCYLPVLAPNDFQHLGFMPFDDTTRFVINRFKIPEPLWDASHAIAPADLDLVIAPLVAFDEHCHRIGMGAGFYDKTFAFLRDSLRPAKPILCGLAYAFQQVDNTQPQAWDIALDYVTTEEKTVVRSI